jgi:hypothetical protein
LLNTRGGEVRRYLEQAFPGLGWRFLEWDSPSSWLSFQRVATELSGQAERFAISTVDALMRPEDVAEFVRRAESADADGTLAVTGFVEDEKPLWVDLAADGLYALSRETARGLDKRRHEKLRDFWTELVREGARVSSVTFEKTVDVDRPEDVRSAETFVRESLCP